VPRAAWWVNQGATYAHERRGAYLWAPRRDRRGAAFAHWTNLARLEPGDTVYHYARGALRATSRVRGPTERAPRPPGSPDRGPGDDGYLAHLAALRELRPPLALADIPLDWRREVGAGPFTRGGAVRQGYLFPLSAELAARLRRLVRDRLAAG
jgi:5-methylcytosine-specific restriction enzyme B